MNMLTGGPMPAYSNQYGSPYPMATGGPLPPQQTMLTGGPLPAQYGMQTGGNLPPHPMSAMQPHYARLAGMMLGNNGAYRGRFGMAPLERF